MKNAFGAIDLLIGLLIISVVFIICMKSFNGISPLNNSVDTKNIQTEVDQKINEIEQMRQQTIEFNNNQEY